MKFNQTKLWYIGMSMYFLFYTSIILVMLYIGSNN